MLWAAARLLPSHMSSWAHAMKCELAAIPGDRVALVFALGCLRAVLSLAIIARLEAARIFLFPPAHPTWSFLDMNGISARPRLLGLICGTAAVGIGIAYMLAAGAPSRYLLVNGAALVLGIVAWLTLGKVAGSRLAGAGTVVLALAVSMLLTALFGVAADGASRWVSVGPLSLQVSLIVLPVMVVLYARRPDVIGTAGTIVASLALAAQPDRAMAGVLLTGLLGVLFAAPNRGAILAAAAAALAFGWTLLTPDTLPASPYVDRILYTAFDVHPFAGLAVVVGALALVVPAAIGAMKGASERSAVLAFGGCWSGVVAAAALGNYPTPLVGYSGSAVLGYLLSVALLSNGTRQPGHSGVFDTRRIDVPHSGQSISDLRVAGLA